MMTQMKDQLKDFLSDHQWVFIVIVFVALIDGILKLFAMWRASRNNEVAWFILLAVLNTAGILPIIYILMRRKKPSHNGHSG
jgi:hypothetical protein